MGQPPTPPRGSVVAQTSRRLQSSEGSQRAPSMEQARPADSFVQGGTPVWGRWPEHTGSPQVKNQLGSSSRLLQAVPRARQAKSAAQKRMTHLLASCYPLRAAQRGGGRYSIVNPCSATGKMQLGNLKLPTRVRQLNEDVVS